MLVDGQLRKSAIAGEDFGRGGLVQLNPLGRLSRELQGQIKSKLDRRYLRNLQSKQGSGGVHCEDSRNKINVCKSSLGIVLTYLPAASIPFLLRPLQLPIYYIDYAFLIL
jgi:hypothetical protein